ncbi:hypothetical protein ScPMuIL_016131 [Solemya velum]
MDLERPLVERIVQKSLITAQSRDRNLSEDEERADQSASEIPPTPSPIFTRFVGTQKRIKSLFPKKDRMAEKQHKLKSNYDDGYSFDSDSSENSSENWRVPYTKTEDKEIPEYRGEHKNNHICKKKQLDYKSSKSGEMGPDSRKSALVRLKLKRSKDKSRPNSIDVLSPDELLREKIERGNGASFRPPHSYSKQNHSNTFIVGDKRKYIPRDESPGAKLCKFDYDSRDADINEMSCDNRKRNDPSTEQNKTVSTKSAVSKLERLKAFRKQKDIALKAAACGKSYGMFSSGSASGEKRNIAGQRDMTNSKNNNDDGYNLNTAVLGGGWPSDSGSDSSDSIILSDVIHPMSQRRLKNISPILHVRGRAESDLHNTVKISPITKPKSPNSVGQIRGWYGSPNSESSWSRSPRPCCAGSPTSPSIVSSKNLNKSPCSVCSKGASFKRLLLSPQHTTGSQGGTEERSPTFSKSSLSKNKEETRRHVIDFLKQKFQSGTPDQSSSTDVQVQIPSNESLGKNIFIKEANDDCLRSGIDSSRHFSKKKNIVRMNSHQDLDQSDCQIIGSSTVVKEKTDGKGSFHSKVLGLPRLPRKGAPKIAPVMGSGWTKASAIHTHHRESLAQGPTQSFEMTMPERNLITMPERNHNKHDSPKLNNIVIDYDIPDTCNISFASVGPSTPSSDRNPHQQLPLSTPDSGVIKLVEQMEADEDYAKQLQEQMDLEFALSLQSQSHESPATSLMGDIEVSPPVHDAPGRPLGLRSRARGRRRGNSAISEAEDAVEESIHNIIFLRGRGRRSSFRNQRRGRGMNFLISSPADGGDDYEMLLNMAEMLGDVKKKGLSHSDSNRLPIRSFQTSDQSSDKHQTDCLICMCDYEEGDSLKILPCFHEFHSSCIDKWIKGNATCPVCRVDVKLQ